MLELIFLQSNLTLNFKTEPNDVTRYQLGYPAKTNSKRVFASFENVASIYLKTKNTALHMHPNVISEVIDVAGAQHNDFCTWDKVLR